MVNPGYASTALSSISPFSRVPTNTTLFPPFKISFSNGPRYPLPLLESVPHVTEAPRGMIFRLTQVSSVLLGKIGEETSSWYPRARDANVDTMPMLIPRRRLEKGKQNTHSRAAMRTEEETY